MKMNKMITLSTVAFLSTTLYAQTDVEILQEQVRALMNKVAELEKTQSTPAATINNNGVDIEALVTKVDKIEKKQAKQTKKLSKVNALAAKDNLKFNVDFRTSYDNIQYTTASGKKYKNDGLYSNRLWLGMGYAPTDTMTFKGQLSYHKAFGASNALQRGSEHGFDTFDWVTNENLTNDSLKVREAYWLWTPTLGDFPLTISVGRRPATNGFLVNLRDDDKAKSPMGHLINMEFDGASIGVKLDKYVPGMLAKLCIGRGLTNANARFNQEGLDYAEDGDNLDNVDMLGLIFKPYDDGQYSIMTKYYRGYNVPGMVWSDQTGPNPTDAVYTMQNTGDMDGAGISFKVDGIGDEINDFLDETILFASYAWSQSRPDEVERSAGVLASGMAPGAMLGSDEKQSGTSYWLGLQTPNLTGGRFGLEYNHGSKYWRAFTYGEDTMIGSKLAARGDAYEAYWTQPIIDDAFSMQIRYTYIKYDYTGSNAFFGDGGTPMSMSEATAMGMDPVEKAQDLRIYFRYRY